MVNALLHLILPTTLNVQGHGVPHLTSSWLIFLFQLLPWQPSYRYDLAVPFSVTPLIFCLLPWDFTPRMSPVELIAQPFWCELRLESMRELPTGPWGIADGGCVFPLLSLRKTILRSFCTVPQRVPARRSPSCPQWPAQCVCLWWLSLLPGFTLPSPLLLPGITSPNISLVWVLDLRPAP